MSDPGPAPTAAPPPQRTSALGFAGDWIAAWNSRDLARVAAHYRDDFSMTSPCIVNVAGEASGTLHGKSSVVADWEKALSRIPNLRFELVEMLVAPAGFVIPYRNQAGVLVAECLQLDAAGQVSDAAAYYA